MLFCFLGEWKVDKAAGSVAVAKNSTISASFGDITGYSHILFLLFVFLSQLL
jgi:hypothetical protein